MAEYKRSSFFFFEWNLIIEEYLHVNFGDFFEELCQNPPEGIVAGPISEDNFFEWESLITGKQLISLIIISS